MPTFSVVIPWANRPVLEATLIENTPLFVRHGVEVIVANAGGDPHALRALLERAAVPNLRSLDIPVTDFNRQLCLNLGALASRSELLCFLDADISLRSDLFAESIDHLRSGTCFVSVQRILESDPAHVIFAKRQDLSFLARVIMSTEIVTHDGRRAVTRDHIIPGKSNTGDGLVLLRRDDMLRVGGLNADLLGYGYEDTDFQIRLQLHLGLERLDLGEVVHRTHDASRVDRQAWQRNYKASLENYRRCHYLGTLERDAAAWSHKLVLQPA